MDKRLLHGRLIQDVLAAGREHGASTPQLLEAVTMVSAELARCYVNAIDSCDKSYDSSARAAAERSQHKMALVFTDEGQVYFYSMRSGRWYRLDATHGYVWLAPESPKPVGGYMPLDNMVWVRRVNALDERMTDTMITADTFMPMKSPETK